MDFRQLKYMLTLAEYQNMTHAAEALYISQSALSHYVKNVEEELGVQLFNRTTTPMTLTYAGKCYMESARRILLEDERLQKELRDITQHMTGKLTIGTSRDRASYMMPRILPLFSERYPGIVPDVFTGSDQKLMDALHSGQVDLVLLPESRRGIPQGVCSEKLFREELVLATKAGVLPGSARDAAHPHTVVPGALKNKPFYLLFPEHESRMVCDAYFKRHRIKPEIRMELASTVSCYCMAAAGLGFAIVPYFTTRLANPSAPTELLSLGPTPETWDVCIFYRKDSYLGAPELELIRIARELFSNERLV